MFSLVKIHLYRLIDLIYHTIGSLITFQSVEVEMSYIDDTSRLSLIWMGL